MIFYFYGPGHVHYGGLSSSLSHYIYEATPSQVPYLTTSHFLPFLAVIEWQPIPCSCSLKQVLSISLSLSLSFFLSLSFSLSLYAKSVFDGHLTSHTLHIFLSISCNPVCGVLIRYRPHVAQHQFSLGNAIIQW